MLLPGVRLWSHTQKRQGSYRFNIWKGNNFLVFFFSLVTIDLSAEADHRSSSDSRLSPPPPKSFNLSALPQDTWGWAGHWVHAHHRFGAQLLAMFQSEPWLHFCKFPLAQLSWLICYVAAVVAHLSCPETALQERILPLAVGTAVGQVEKKSLQSPALVVSGLSQLH